MARGRAEGKPQPWENKSARASVYWLELELGLGLWMELRALTVWSPLLYALEIHPAAQSLCKETGPSQSLPEGKKKERKMGTQLGKSFAGHSCAVG